MQNISNIVDATNEVNAGQFKEVCGEEENLILSSGQTLSQSDLLQIAKAIAIYSARGDAYTDTGTQNNITLTPVAAMAYPPSYVVGLRVRFSPAYTNTIAQVNMRIAALGNAYLCDRTLPSGQNPTIETSWLVVGKWYTAIYSYSGTHYYWKLEVPEQDDFTTFCIPQGALASQAVTSSNLATGCVVNFAIGSEAVTNDKVYADIQLNKISGGTLAFSDITMGGTSLRYGAVSEPNTRIEREGITFSGTDSPGNLSLPFRVGLYNIQTQIAASSLSDARTRTDSTGTAHSHRIGQQYVFGAALNTEIPNSSGVFGATISYIEQTTGRKVSGVPVIVTSQNGATYQEIIAISIANVKDAAVDYVINSSQSVVLCIFFSGSNL